MFNFGAFLLPALYETLTKLWVAETDAAHVVTTDVKTYIGVVTEVINEGLPRAAWIVIGNKASQSLSQRLKLTYTLIAFQSFLGLIMSIAFISAPNTFAKGFIPSEVIDSGPGYIRICAFATLASTLETAVATATRAFDKPDVPLVISSVKFSINILLDLLLISKFHVGNHTPTVNIQGSIYLGCNLLSAVAGLLYFLCTNRQPRGNTENRRPSLSALMLLAYPGILMFVESLVRNAIYLWIVSGIVALGTEYGTAWGVFNTIRWGIVMVPVQSLEATSLAFIGHNWGQLHQYIDTFGQTTFPLSQQYKIFSPALKSLAIAVIVEIPLCIFLSFFGAEKFAYYLSGSKPVAKITAHMWKTIDWCYIFYAASTQLATILLAARPRLYLYQSLTTNLLYMLPWAIVCQKTNLKANMAWLYHSLVFGGSNIFTFIVVVIVTIIWTWRLKTGYTTLNNAHIV